MRLTVWFVVVLVVSLTYSSKIYTVELKSRQSKQVSYHTTDVQNLVDPVFKSSSSPLRNLKSITKDITNFKDLQYYGELYIGSKKAKMTFIYDTGSAWVWVPTELCKTCPTDNKLNMDDSETLEILSINPEILVYGTGEVGGIKIQDDVWLEANTDQRVKGLDMLGIIVANGIDGDVADGILGLGPMKSGEDRSNFVSALKQQGLIDYEIFSFDFQMEGKQSKMIFGDIDTSIVDNFHDINWIPVLDKDEADYWKLPLSSMSYGKNKIKADLEFAVIDTGSSTLALSETNFLYFMKSVLDTGLECGFFLDEKFVACLCENGPQDFKPIRMNLSGHIFTLDPEDYIAYEDDICVILIYNLGDRMVVADDTIVLGASFLRKYYTVFDLEKERVGVYGNPISSKANYIQEAMIIGLIMLIALSTLMLYIYLNHKDRVMSEKIARASLGNADKVQMHKQITIKI